MQQIHINKIRILVVIMAILCINIYAQNKKEYNNVKSSEDRIQELVSIITTNLQGTTVLDNFLEEQKLWEKYCNAHIETLFPDVIDGIKMEWGSIVGYEASQEILKMNIDRIKILEAYLDNHHETGTDGKGAFKEYVNELRRINKSRPKPRGLDPGQ